MEVSRTWSLSLKIFFLFFESPKWNYIFVVYLCVYVSVSFFLFVSVCLRLSLYLLFPTSPSFLFFRSSLLPLPLLHNRKYILKYIIYGFLTAKPLQFIYLSHTFPPFFIRFVQTVSQFSPFVTHFRNDNTPATNSTVLAPRVSLGHNISPFVEVLFRCCCLSCFYFLLFIFLLSFLIRIFV